jgi:orotidine-5'-phosphate decarboxylase
MKTGSPDIIIALDVPASDDLAPILETIPDPIRFGKVGLELFCAEGPGALQPLKDRGWRVFLDLKLHDIPRTVERAVRSAAGHGVDLLTLHAAGGGEMLKAAAAAAKDFGENRPRLIAVTTLTSMNQNDLASVGIGRSLGDQAAALAELALSAGMDGLVTSVHEARSLRDKFGPGPLLVTPGIRMPGGEAGDQKRIATPADAVAAGATHLVVGRPILEAGDRAEATAAILENMQQTARQ